MTTQERMEALMAFCRKAETQPPRARFSNAMGCMRSHVYDLRLLDAGTWPTEVDRPARWNFAAEVGNTLGREIEWAAECLGAQVQVRTALSGDGTPCEISVVDGETEFGLKYTEHVVKPKPFVVGALDIEWPDSVWDLKWVGEYKWRKVKHEPDPTNAAQVNGYAVARGKPKWALIYLPIHLLGKGEALEYIIHEGEADPARARAEITDRWASVAAHRSAGTLPDREIPQETCERLKCMHRQYCWETNP